MHTYIHTQYTHHQDVLSHAVESYTARRFTMRSAPTAASGYFRPSAQGGNEFSDYGCLAALRLVGEHYERAVGNANTMPDRRALDAMMFAAVQYSLYYIQEFYYLLLFCVDVNFKLFSLFFLIFDFFLSLCRRIRRLPAPQWAAQAVTCLTDCRIRSAVATSTGVRRATAGRAMRL